MMKAHLALPHTLPKLGLEQQEALERNFKENRNPSDLDITIIAAEVGVDETSVKMWYRHRLACWRQQQGLPANSGSVNQ